MTGLSEWTLKHSHVGHAEAAKLLGVGPRKLWDIVHEHPHYERRGRANRYYPEHIEALRKVTGREDGCNRAMFAAREKEAKAMMEAVAERLAKARKHRGVRSL